MVIAGYHDRDISNIRGWFAAARGVPDVTGFMYTTWQRRSTHLEEYGKALRGECRLPRVGRPDPGKSGFRLVGGRRAA